MDTDKFQELVLQQLTALNEGQQELRSDVIELQKGQNELKTDVSDLKKGQNELKSDISELKKGQLRLETRLESEVIDKLRALFDDRELQNNRLDRIDEKLDSIEIDTGYLVSRVSRLEKLAK